MTLRLSPGSHLGNSVRSGEFAGFLLAEHSYRPGHRLPEHAHQRAYFNLVLAGGYSERFGNAWRECKPGSVLFHPAGELHSERMSGQGSRLFSVEPLLSCASVRPHVSSCLEDPAEFHRGAISRLASRLYRELRCPDVYSPLVVEGLVLEMVAERGRFKNRLRADLPPTWLTRAEAALRERFAIPPSLSELAAEVGVHPVHLARTFRVHFGCSVGEHVRQLRVEYACARLANSEEPIASIALAAGFVDQSHFSRTFKRSRGLTPGEFRSCHRAR
jgi:AraC family transcriptional regulator